MKKLITLLALVFLTNALLYGQCPDEATPNPTNRTFNLSYFLEADRDMAWGALESITFPAGTGCMCGATITIPKADLTIDGPVGANDAFRIRAVTTIDDNFGGENGNFVGDIIFNFTDGSSETCDYLATSVNSIDESLSVRIFPNPVKNQLTFTNGKGQATIYNVLGQAVKHLTVADEQATIQLGELLNGQYYLQVLRADGKIVTKQFSKSE